VLVKGYNVRDISIVNTDGENESKLKVGEKLRVNPNYTPVSSIVSETRWHSDNESVATVDQNGVITAVSAGTANITVEANRYDEKDVFVTSSVHKVEVAIGASKFGSEFSTSKTTFTLNEIGVKPSDVLKKDGTDDYDCVGCEIAKSGIVTIIDDVAIIATKYGTITVNKCDADDIIIENADIYNASAGYVFEVSGLTLKLRAVWADVLKEGTPDGVVWEVGDDYSKIITIDENGEVSALESGLVEDIRAIRNGKTATLMLNVQVKLAAMSLRTGNAHFAVGRARETVFAAEKYRFENSDSTDKDPNSVLIRIIDEPKAPKPEDFDNANDYEKQYTAYKKQLATFYNAYKYEIVSSGYYVYNEKGQHVVDDEHKYKIEEVDGIYALFSGDASEPNRLTFIPSALKGQGKLTLRVKVSAKYPKYEGNDSYTSEDVDINVIYGVEVNDIVEFRKASAEQKAYAYAEGNLQEKELGWEHNSNVEAGGKDILYRYYDAEYSLTTYGISVMGNLRYEDEKDDDGNIIKIYDSNNVRIYGDVYGNGYMLSAERNQVNDVDAMLWIGWSNVTVSNLTIRANKMGENDMLTTDETKGLKGQCLQIYHVDDMPRCRISGVRVEYCILENARRAMQSYNADYTFDGIVVRNVDSVAFYVPARMYDYEEDGIRVYYPVFSHVTINNSVFANCLNTIGSYSYERFSVVPADNGKKYEGRFIADDLTANAEHFKKYFIAAGVNTKFTQTGFLDVYNWQNVESANVIDTGDPKTND
ncbi:MAG: Ig-like domain-containing protein, partial [Clostridia bacterium]|nr:Ig-like domain-containing protein [Clostridia bacterium]